MSVLQDYPERPGIPDCPCCGGNGMHEHRPYIHASPYDSDEECSTCGGTGTSWFESRRNACIGYLNLMRRFQ